MVEVIGIHVDLANDEIGKSHLDDRVLAVMREIPRHLFVPALLAAAAYSDGPLPIGFDKTISQPFMVALMTASLDFARLGGTRTLRQDLSRCGLQETTAKPPRTVERGRTFGDAARRARAAKALSRREGRPRRSHPRAIGSAV